MSIQTTVQKTLATLVLAAFAACGSTGSNDKGEQRPAYTTILTFTNKEGLEYTLPIAYVNNHVEVVSASGKGNDPLIFREAATPNNTFVNTQSYLVLTNAEGYTHIARFQGTDPTTSVPRFYDPALGDIEVTDYNTVKHTGTISLGPTMNYKFKVDPQTGKLAIDQNGDGKFDGSCVSIVRKEGAQITQDKVSKD